MIDTCRFNKDNTYIFRCIYLVLVVSSVHAALLIHICRLLQQMPNICQGSTRPAYCQRCCTQGTLHRTPCVVHDGSHGPEILVHKQMTILLLLLQEEDQKWHGCSVLLTS